MFKFFRMIEILKNFLTGIFCLSGLSSFIRWTNIPDMSVLQNVLALVKCKEVRGFNLKGIEYTCYTFVLKPNKKLKEDEIYGLNPELINILPRACSIFVGSDGTCEPLIGPSKFFGFSQQDEDPDDGQSEVPVETASLFNFSTVLSWAKNNVLEMIQTIKLNGKFWITRITETGIILCGSKNCHIAFFPEDIDRVIKENEHNNIMLAGLLDIKANLDKLMNPELRAFFNKGYSLVGELCDGQHFFCIEGDQPYIGYFGLFVNGNAHETMITLDLLRSIGIQTVDYKVVFPIGSDPDSLSEVFNLSRCMNCEGTVIRCRNIETGETILVKSKSRKYIFFRMLRMVLLNHGYVNIDRIRQRIIETASYHQLNTDACVRLAKQLINFSFWMISKMYPSSVLGHMPVESVRGKLPNGFCKYWDEYIKEGHPDIEVTPADFGEFEESVFLANTEIYEKRAVNNPAIVLFTQDLQGSGKSTLAARLCEFLKSKGISACFFEQDGFYGDTLSCQGAIHHAVARADGPSVVIVSRCNANSKHYDRYLQMLYRLPCLINFIAPEKVDHLHLMFSLAGILNRSATGDRLMVGRFELPIDQVIKFTRENLEGFKTHPLAWTITTRQCDEELAELASQLKTDTAIEAFITSHQARLHGLRLPIDEIVAQVYEIVMRIMSGDVSHAVYNLKPIFVGLAVNPDDRRTLQAFVEEHHPTDGFTTYLHHTTVEFPAGKKAPNGQVRPGQIAVGVIDALVVRKSDGACAFRLSSLTTEGRTVVIENKCPHITAKGPKSFKPMGSNEFIDSTDPAHVDIFPCSFTLEMGCFYSS